MERLLYTIPEVCERLRLGRNSIYRLIDSGDLHPVKIGKSVRLPADELTAYVERLREEQATPV